MIAFNLKLLSITFLFFLLSTVVNAQHKSPGFVLKGIITGSTDGSVVTLFDIEGQKFLDSATITNKGFELKGYVAKPTTCWLFCDNEYAVIQIENTNMSFTSVLKEMKLNYTAEGGREQTLQSALNSQQRPYERITTYATDSLNYKLYSDTIHKAKLKKTVETAQNTYMNIYVAFGQKHIDSYIGMDIVYRNRQRIPKDSILLLYNGLPSSLKATPIVKGLHTYATNKLAVKGEQFVDFDVKTIQGQPFKLSALKGKYIYLAFGSFSCGPCRMENREIAKQYEELSKNMVIVNFSLDINRKEWEAAAKLDKIVWYNVSDMKGSAGKIKTIYDVQAMPTSYLIDPNGLIVERFEGYSEENITRIAQIANKKTD
jgi:thiol-disulfide isomerase/thioredoxin